MMSTSPSLTSQSLRSQSSLSIDVQSCEQARISHEQAFELSKRPDLSLKYPHISPSSVKRGKILGQGGFAKVYEISGLEIHNDFNPASIEQSCSSAICESKICSLGSISCGPEDQSTSYALKTLITDPGGEINCQALSDLVTEARILAEVKHSNIVKLRAVASGDRFHKDFFIVVEKLFDPLDIRIDQWRQQDTRLKGLSGRVRDWTGKKRADLFLDRLVAGYQLGSALEHLHRNRFVYRDLKLENAAFDMHGELKLFDFGLAKELPDECPSRDGLHKLTGKTGTLRYQAPEVALGLPYNESCDVYSFSILLWEILIMKRAFKDYTSEHIMTMVLEKPYKRPPKSTKWNAALRENMHHAWSPVIRQRPSMSAMVNMLEDECTKCPGYNEKLGLCGSPRSDCTYADPTKHLCCKNQKLRRSNTEQSSLFSD
ncbi:unnamed protein product [Cylindrotheca closterium]|uniref:Protein kinase domain-containing protein n=1 Tax=Cylindrotheca closterium TaxID=2856 RepID=A0AAD2G2G3_9STRA|nr:unnamed protein product [Cylindrotheca closterium]